MLLGFEQLEGLRYEHEPMWRVNSVVGIPDKSVPPNPTSIVPCTVMLGHHIVFNSCVIVISWEARVSLMHRFESHLSLDVLFKQSRLL